MSNIHSSSYVGEPVAAHFSTIIRIGELVVSDMRKNASKIQVLAGTNHENGSKICHLRWLTKTCQFKIKVLLDMDKQFHSYCGTAL